jgi:hypothetical protein
VTALLAGNAGGVGYPLKDRVADAVEFGGVVERVAADGTALDPEVVTKLMCATARSAGSAASLLPRFGIGAASSASPLRSLPD